MIWHVWVRRPGIEMWHHHQLSTERAARGLAAIARILGLETQVQQGSWSD